MISIHKDQMEMLQEMGILKTLRRKVAKNFYSPRMQAEY